MANEQEDVVDLETNEEGAEVEEEIQSEEAPEQEEVKQEKPVESPEDRASRLTRQANQARKKAGLAPLGEKTAEQKEPVRTEGMSTQDTIAIIKADVHTDDIPEVEDWARFKKTSIAEALKNPTLKAILAEKAEQREVAEATNVKTTRRSPQKVSELDIIAKAAKGEFPDDPADLARARTAKLRAESGQKS